MPTDDSPDFGPWQQVLAYRYVLIGALIVAFLAYNNRAAEPSMEPAKAAFAPSADDEALYLDRFARMGDAFRTGKSLTTIYDTRAPLVGASSVQPLPASNEDLLGDDVRGKAINYAQKMNSAALLVMKSGKVVLEKYFGETNAQTLLNSKSLAKPLSVVAVGRAIERGFIKSLDQPAADFLTEWQGTPKAAITLRHLLSMRSGMLHQQYAPKPEDILNRAYLHPRHDEIIINDYPLNHAPGARYDYSNANGELIAPIIARATGLSYQDWVSQEILKRIGAAGGEIWVNRTGGTAHSGCCAMLPAQTFARLGLLVMNDGVWEGQQLLPTGYVDEIRKPGGPDNIHVGMGIYLGRPYAQTRGFQNPDRSTGGVFHSAPYEFADLELFDGNSNQVVYMARAQDVLILRMGKSPPRETPWDNAYLPNLIAHALKP